MASGWMLLRQNRLRFNRVRPGNCWALPWAGLCRAFGPNYGTVFDQEIQPLSFPFRPPPPTDSSTRRMQTREQNDNGLDVLAIEGEIDLACSPELREILHAFAKKKCPVLVLDFAGVKYVDSSGLATLVEYVRLAQPYGGKFALVTVSDRVRTIFDLVRLTEFFPIYPSLAEARAALLTAPGA